MKSTELSYYGLYLFSFFMENHPDKLSDIAFVKSRSDHAAAVFEQARLDGCTPDGAQELAIKALMQGLHFSRYNTLIEVLWNEFADEVPQSEAPMLAIQLIPQVESVFATYPLSDDFAHTSEYDHLYTELTGAVLIYIEEHGI